MKYITTPVEISKALTKKHSGLYEKINKIIEKIDPMGIAFIEDEYSIEVLDIIGNLERCNSVQDVRSLVYQVFTKWFSANDIKYFEKDKNFDIDIFEIKNEFSL